MALQYLGSLMVAQYGPERERTRQRMSRGPFYYIVLTAVIVLAAAILRGPFVAVAPVARAVSADLDISAPTVGMLTSIPVFCFAVFSPAVVALIRRAGTDFVLTIMFLGVIVGCLVRVGGSIELALVGTMIMGIFLTVGNVVVPVIVGREFGTGHVHTMTGVYTASLSIGTMAATVGTAPLSDAIGWRWAISIWAICAAVALLCWILLRGPRSALIPRSMGRMVMGVEIGPVWRHAPTLLVATAFAGQAFAFYGVTAWLPKLLADDGYSSTASGAIAAIFQFAGIAGSLLLPIITTKSSVQVGIVVVATGWLAIPLGFLLAPEAWLLWCLIGGLAQGGAITVVFIMINSLALDERTKAARSGAIQSIGYGLAATAPIALGAIQGATGAWAARLLIILTAVLAFLFAGALANQSIRRER